MTPKNFQPSFSGKVLDALEIKVYNHEQKLGKEKLKQKG